MAPTGTPPRDAEQASQWYIDQMIETANGDDMVLLRLLAEHMRLVKVHTARVLDVRDGAAGRLRDGGKPMTQIALVAGVTDSALSRRLLDDGATRRSDRRHPPRQREAGDDE